MKTYLLQYFLLLFGKTAVHGQVNLSSVPIDYSDGLQKSNIKYFSRRKVRRNRIRDNPKEKLWDGCLCISYSKITK